MGDGYSSLLKQLESHLGVLHVQQRCLNHREPPSGGDHLNLHPGVLGGLVDWVDWWYLTVTVGTLHSLVTTLQPPGTALQLYSVWTACLLSASVITHLLCFHTITTLGVAFTAFTAFTHNIINYQHLTHIYPMTRSEPDISSERTLS